MFARFKEFGSNLYQKAVDVYHIVIETLTPTNIYNKAANILRFSAKWLFSIGRVTASAGLSISTFGKFMKWATGTTNHWLTPYGIILIVLCNIVVNSATRVPAIMRQFRRKNKPIEIPPPRGKKTCCNPCFKVSSSSQLKLGYLGVSIYLFMIVTGVLSGIFTSVNSELGSVTFIRFLMEELFDIDLSDEGVKQYSVESIAFFFAFCNLFSFLTYNLVRIDHNAKILAWNMEHHKIPKTKEAAASTVITVVAVCGIPFFAHLTTHSSMDEIFGEHMPEVWKRIIAGGSSLCSVPSYMMANCPSMHDAICQKQQSFIFTKERCWEKPAKYGVYVIGVGDSIGTWISTFTGFIKTSEKVFHIDGHDVSMVTFAALASVFTAKLNFFFGVKDGIKAALADYHIQRGEVAYQVVLQFDQESASEKDLESNDDECEMQDIDSGFKNSVEISPKIKRHATSPFLFKEREKTARHIANMLDLEIKPYHYSF